MWCEANNDIGWLGLDGMTGGDSLVHLQKGLDELMKRPAYYKQWDAPNGWGLHHHLVDFIERCILAAKDYPKMKWRTSR